MKKEKLILAVKFLCVLALLLAMAVQRNDRLLGHEITQSQAAVTDTGLEDVKEKAITDFGSGKYMIETTDIASDIIGFGGSVPMQISVSEGKITEIKVLPNSETPDFFAMVENEVIPRWIGMDVNEALTAQVDGVSGATYSSNAVNGTIRRAMEVATEHEMSAENNSHDFTAGWIVSLIVVLVGAILPLFFKNKIYRILQLATNVVVLGFWCGTFISYSSLISYLSNGMNLLESLPFLVLVVAGFIYPFFGKKNHYCLWMCPMGSLQELSGKLSKKRIQLSPKLVRYLGYFREALWLVLVVSMVCGVWMSWIDYELFTAFMFEHASLAVVIVAVFFVLLSVFVPRPFCRFVCPVGCMFDLMERERRIH